VSETAAASRLKEPGKPVVSLVLGLVGLVAWVVPIAGLPITIVGLVVGAKALKRARRGMAVAGTVL
jgi:hypothetical protein